MKQEIIEFISKFDVKEVQLGPTAWEKFSDEITKEVYDATGKVVDVGNPYRMVKPNDYDATVTHQLI